MKRFTSWVSAVCLLMLTAATSMPAHAMENCPRSIGAFTGDLLVEHILDKMLPIYEELGCPVIADTLPLKRSLINFNKGKIDGEVFRLRLIEPRYTREFVRSEEPLFNLRMVMWNHRDGKLAHRMPMGFVQGIAWHEKFAETYDRPKRSFTSEKDMIAAYNNGRLGAVLLNQFDMNLYMAEDALRPPPVETRLIAENFLYHYLGKEFTPFMKKFSARLKTDHPFIGY